MSAFGRLDDWLIRKIFAPIAHATDNRLHLNPWQLAAKIMMVSAVLVTADAMINNTKKTWGGLSWNILITCMIIGIRAIEVYKLSKISDSYEKRPDILPADTIFFIQPFSRVMHIFLSLWLCPLDFIGTYLLYHNNLWAVTIHYLPQLWFFVAGIGYYFAAVPRPPAKRKEKKVHAPIGAQLAGIKS